MQWGRAITRVASASLALHDLHCGSMKRLSRMRQQTLPHEPCLVLHLAWSPQQGVVQGLRELPLLSQRLPAFSPPAWICSPSMSHCRLDDLQAQPMTRSLLATGPVKCSSSSGPCGRWLCCHHLPYGRTAFRLPAGRPTDQVRSSCLIQLSTPPRKATDGECHRDFKIYLLKYEDIALALGLESCVADVNVNTADPEAHEHLDSKRAQHGTGVEAAPWHFSQVDLIFQALQYRVQSFSFFRNLGVWCERS